MNTYFQTDTIPQIGDSIATGSMGQCNVLAIGNGILHVRNIMTGEETEVYTDDCDLIDRTNA